MKRTLTPRLAIVALAVLVLTSGQSRADLIYKYSGVLPTDVTITGDMIGQVAAGESWVALVTVDSSIEDLTPNKPTLGYYPSAGLNVRLRFSGGYEAYIDGPGQRVGSSGNPNIGVGDNFQTGEDPPDGYWDGVVAVVVDRFQTSEYVSLVVQTIDTSTLSSVALPLHPTTFVQHRVLDVNVLSYVSPGEGVVWYLSPNDGLFEVVPEPSTVAMWYLFALIGGIVAWRRHKRA